MGKAAIEAEHTVGPVEETAQVAILNRIIGRFEL